jgi:hypothetical protein
MSDNLITINQLSTVSGLSWHVINKAAKDAGLKPEHTFKTSRGIGALYDQAAMMKLVERLAAERRPPEVKPEPEQPIAALPAVGVDQALVAIRSLADGLAGLQARFDDLEESLAASFRLATEQNAALLRAIEALKPSAVTVRAGVHDHVGAAPLPIKLAPIVEQPKPAPERKRIVTIVGLTQAQYAEIGTEFGESFDLRHWEAGDVRRPNFTSAIKSSDAVVAMVKFIGHDAMHKMKVAGVKATPINGGMSSLRTELTRLFCEEPVVA